MIKRGNRPALCSNSLNEPANSASWPDQHMARQTPDALIATINTTGAKTMGKSYARWAALLVCMVCADWVCAAGAQTVLSKERPRLPENMMK
ncbi:MAG TPA: hypothetical protein VK751_01720, partial [Undibacterium sp.]|nr:hypothetical protein [Undibacterium sp.]